jgi:opacity protein-like surface antigen
MTDRRASFLVVAALVLLLPASAAAWDETQVFKKNTLILSVESGYGKQFNLEGFSVQSDIEFLLAGVRLGILPFGPTGSGLFHGAFEVGLEAIALRYTEPRGATYGGLALATRYHFLWIDRFVPYVELAAAAGGTDLEVREIRSTFAFQLFGGVGASVFLTDSTALYAGYRYTHISNGNTSRPNRGFEANTGVLGLSFFFH